MSERERQVFTQAAMGLSNKLIAHSLGLTISTVATHLDRARRKLGGGVGLEALLAATRRLVVKAPRMASAGPPFA